MRVKGVVAGLAMGFAASGAGAADLAAPPVSHERGRIVWQVVRTSVACIGCSAPKLPYGGLRDTDRPDLPYGGLRGASAPRLPYGGLRRAAAPDLPYGGLREDCPPVRRIRSVVLSSKG